MHVNHSDLYNHHDSLVYYFSLWTLNYGPTHGEFLTAHLQSQQWKIHFKDPKLEISVWLCTATEFPAGPQTHQLLDTHLIICKGKIRPPSVAGDTVQPAAKMKSILRTSNRSCNTRTKHPPAENRSHQVNTKELDQTLWMVFLSTLTTRAGVLLACPDTDLMSLSISQETQRPPCNNSTEERTRNTLGVSYCKKSLLFSLLSWEAWKTATCTAGSSKQPQGKQHECARCLQSLCTPQAREVSVWRSDKTFQHNLTWLLQQLPTQHLYLKLIVMKDFFFHRKFYWL